MIEISGFDELEDFVQGMTITDQDERRAMKAALEPVYDKTQKVTPVRSETLKKSEIMQVKKEDLAVVGVVRYGMFWDIFNEFGTSKDKSHVGFFERAVNETTDEAIGILTEMLTNKVI